MPNALDNLTLRASVLEVLIQTDFTLKRPSTLGRHEGFCKDADMRRPVSGVWIPRHH